MIFIVCAGGRGGRWEKSSEDGRGARGEGRDSVGSEERYIRPEWSGRGWEGANKDR